MEQENTSEILDLVRKGVGSGTEESGHITTSSRLVVSPPAEDAFAWLQVLGAFALNLNTW